MRFDATSNLNFKVPHVRIANKYVISEHGPTGGDEINIIEKGHYYGWGVVSMGLQPGISTNRVWTNRSPVIRRRSGPAA
jgi:hypothetical protein